jgi:hypothetical protein
MTATYPTGKVLTCYALFGGGIGGLIHLIGVMLFPINETISRHSVWHFIWIYSFNTNEHYHSFKKNSTF